MMLKIVNIYPCDKLLKKKIFTYLAFQIPYKTILSVLISRISLKTIYAIIIFIVCIPDCLDHFWAIFEVGYQIILLQFTYIEISQQEKSLIHRSNDGIFILLNFMFAFYEMIECKKRYVVVLEIKPTNQTKSSGAFY